MNILLSEHTVVLSGQPLRVKVLTSQADKSRGYQFQKRTPKYNQALLFVFDSEDTQSFHMRNVCFDLDLLAFDGNGVFLGYVFMEAGSRKSYSTDSCCKYVIEAQPGWGDKLHKGVTRMKFARSLGI